MWSTIQTQHQFAITMTPMCTLKSANSLVFTASRACEFAAKEHMYVLRMQYVVKNWRGGQQLAYFSIYNFELQQESSVTTPDNVYLSIVVL